MISVLAAGVMYARAGVYRMQASEAGVRKSNDEIKRVTLGLLGVLSLFVILYTFNKDLLSGNVGLDGLRAAAGKGGGIVSGGGGDMGGGGATGGFGTPVPTPSTNGTEQANRNALSAQGITINKPACVGSDTSCTNVGNMNPATVNMLLKLKAECNCSLMVTGGSEPGHSTNSNHGPGKEAVDIQYTEQLGTFLKSKSIIANSPPCNVKYGYSGFIFWDEPESGCGKSTARHFHASFTGR